jgi:heme exporter protein B
MNTTSLLSAWRTVLLHDLLLAMRQRTDILMPLVFFVIVTSLFPLGVGPELAVLRNIGPGVVWVAALLANLLALQRMFANDLHNGTLEQLLLTPHPLSVLVSARILSHWLTAGLPLVVISPLLGLQMGLSTSSLLVLGATLLLGTPVLSCLGAVGAALTLGLRGGGVLLSLLVLPLYTPVLIFGTGAVSALQSGLDIEGHLSLLAALLAVTAVFAPWVTAATLRISLD